MRYTRHVLTDGGEWHAEARFIDQRGKTIERMPVGFCAGGYGNTRSELDRRAGGVRLIFDTVEFVDDSRLRRIQRAQRLRLSDGVDFMDVELESVDGEERHGFYFTVRGTLLDVA